MSEINLPDKYAFDVFIDLQPRYKPRLLDINIWPSDSETIYKTDPMLFEIDELNDYEVNEDESIDD